MSRLIEVWNSFAGVAPFNNLKPVKKFPDRKAAVARIWEAVQRLVPDWFRNRRPDVAPAKGKAKKPPPSGQTTRHGAPGREENGQRGPRGQQESRSGRPDAPA